MKTDDREVLLARLRAMKSGDVLDLGPLLGTVDRIRTAVEAAKDAKWGVRNLPSWSHDPFFRVRCHHCGYRGRWIDKPRAWTPVVMLERHQAVSSRCAPARIKKWYLSRKEWERRAIDACFPDWPTRFLRFDAEMLASYALRAIEALERGGFS